MTLQFDFRMLPGAGDDHAAMDNGDYKNCQQHQYECGGQMHALCQSCDVLTHVIDVHPGTDHPLPRLGQARVRKIWYDARRIAMLRCDSRAVIAIHATL